MRRRRSWPPVAALDQVRVSCAGSTGLNGGPRAGHFPPTPVGVRHESGPPPGANGATKPSGVVLKGPALLGGAGDNFCGLLEAFAGDPTAQGARERAEGVDRLCVVDLGLDPH